MATRDPQIYLDTANNLLAQAASYSPLLMTSSRDIMVGVEALTALATAHIAMAECTYRATWWETAVLVVEQGSHE